MLTCYIATEQNGRSLIKTGDICLNLGHIFKDRDFCSDGMPHGCSVASNSQVWGLNSKHMLSKAHCAATL